MKIIKYACLLGVVLFLLWLIVPRSYDVLPFEARQGTEYWTLNNGSKIGYTKLTASEPVQPTPILYLHGGPGGMVKDKTICFFEPLAQAGFDIYLYDQIGSGHSDRLANIGDYSVNRHVADLAAIIETIGAEQVILFGHSWGTMLAADYFASHQDKVAQMIFSGSGPMLPFNRQLRKIQAPDSLNLIAPKYTNRAGNEQAQNWRTKLVDFWANAFQQKLASDAEMDDFFTHLNNLLSKSTTCDGSGVEAYKGGGGYYTHIMTVRSFHEVQDKRSQISGNQLPLLLLKGQCDNQVWGYTQEYLNLFPNSTLKIINGAGHSIVESKQAEYLKSITGFLDIE